MSTSVQLPLSDSLATTGHEGNLKEILPANAIPCRSLKAQPDRGIKRPKEKEWKLAGEYR
jgi:hypothetical protein